MNAVEARGRAIVYHRYLIEHESCHAAAALCLGLNVTEIRVDRPDATTAGRVRVVGAETHPRELALAVLAAPLLDDTTPTPDWPLVDYEGATDDERMLIDVIDELELDRVGWDRLVEDCWNLVCTPGFNLASTAIAAFLAEWPAIKGERLDRVTDYIRNQELEETARVA